MEGNTLGIYLHIPFCESRCPYCGFLSSADFSSLDRMNYVDILCREIELSSYEVNEMTDGSKVNSLFIGGGTPSVLAYKEIEKILQTAHKSFALTDDAEITMEANPSSLTLDKAKAFNYYGGNRMSIGAQAFTTETLRMLGRIHAPEDISKAVKTARTAGIDNINLDLIFAIPKQRMEDFVFSLGEAFKLNPSHISFYSLQIEENTKFYYDYKNERMPEIDEELANVMYYRAIEKLATNNFNHYEISNACIPGYSSRHNMKYWKHENYLGLGIGSATFINPLRGNNPADAKEWEEGLADKLPLRLRSRLTNEGIDEEKKVFIMTALRLRQGLNISDFNKEFDGADFEKEYLERASVAQLITEGKLEYRDDYLKIAKEAILHSNSITRAFF